MFFGVTLALMVGMAKLYVDFSASRKRVKPPIHPWDVEPPNL